MSENNQETAVFISYSRRDKAFVQKLHAGIAAAGFKTWVDWEGIELTSDWWEEIQHGIEDADAFAFIISPDSLKSKVCHDEVEWAVHNNKRFIPIVFREPEPNSKLHPKIASHNWVFMRDDRELEANLPQLLKVINTDLNWVRDHTRYQKRALQWESRNRSNSFLLRGEDLLAAESWLAEGSRHGEQQPTDLQIDYIQAGRTYESKRQRQIRMIGGVAILVFLAITIFAVIQFISADAARDTAVAAQATAEAERLIAEAQSTIAFDAQKEAEAQEAIASQNETLALTREAEAVAAQTQAEEAQIEAEANEQLSNARLLVSEGESVFTDDPVLGLALVAEGLMLADDLDMAEEVLGSSQTEVFQWGRQALLADMVGPIIYNSEGNWLLFDFEDHPAELINAANFEVLAELSGELREWKPSPDGETAVALYWEHPAELRDLITGEHIAELPLEIDRTQFSPDGSKLLINLWQGPSVLIDSTNGLPIRELEGFAAEASFSHDGRRLLVFLDGAGVNQLIDTSDGSTLLELPDELISWEFSPDGSVLLTVDIDGQAQLLNAEDGSLLSQFSGEGVRWTFSPSGESLFLIYPRGESELRSTLTGAALGPRFMNLGAWGFSPDGRRFIMADMEGGGQLIDTATGAIIESFLSDVEGWEFSQDSSWLIIDNFDGRGELRDGNNGTLIEELLAPLINWRFSPSEQYLLLNYEGAPAELRDLTNETVVTVFSDELQEWGFSPTENWLVFREFESAPALLDLATGEVVTQLSPDLSNWAFSLDERWLLTQRRTGDSEIWNVAEGYFLAPLDSNAANIYFIPETDTAVVRYQDGDTYQLDLSWLIAMHEAEVLEERDAETIRQLVELACQYPLANKAIYEATLQEFLNEFEIGSSLACP